MIFKEAPYDKAVLAKWIIPFFTIPLICFCFSNFLYKKTAQEDASTVYKNIDAKDIKQITIYERWRIEEKKIKNEQIQILSKNAPQLLTFVKSLNKFQEGRRWSRGETIRLFDVKVFLDNDELIFFNITLKKEHPNIAFLSFKNKTKSYWNAESKALYFWLKQNGLLE